MLHLKHLSWYEHFLSVLAKYGFEELASDLKGHLRPRFVPKPIENLAQKHTRPVRVRLALEELGPTFVKLGQLLSLRPDLIPHEYVEELQHLQDQATPVEFDAIKLEVETQLNGKISDFFSRFDADPLAAGSIAQVHYAETMNGEHVAVKVRRPGIEKTIKTECEILVGLVDMAADFLRGEGIPNPHRIVQEFTQAVAKEVDLRHERHNQERFSFHFADDSRFYIPRVYKSLSSEGVLTMEYVKGVKLVDMETILEAGLDPEVIAERSVDFILEQIFERHFFHTDPHPGNIFILPGNVVCLIDFGQAVSVILEVRRLLMKWLKAILSRDVRGMLRMLRQEEVLSEGTDVNKLALQVEEVFDYYFSMPAEEIPFRDLLVANMDLLRKFQIITPPGFPLILKSLLTVDGVCKRLTITSDIIPVLSDYAERYHRLEETPYQVRTLKYALMDAGELIMKIPDHINTILKELRRGEFNMQVHVDSVERLAKVLHVATRHVSGALIIGASLLASSILVRYTNVVLGPIKVQTFGVIGYIVSLILGVWLFIWILRKP
jgi:ubiquinone biosynthesis protein